MIGQLLLCFAFVLFCLGTFFGPAPSGGTWGGRFNLVSAGLAAWTLSELLGRWPR